MTAPLPMLGDPPIIRQRRLMQTKTPFFER